MASGSFQLGFGIEIELLLRPKAQISGSLAQSGFNHKVSSIDVLEEKLKGAELKKAQKMNDEKNANRLAFRKTIADMIAEKGVPAIVEKSLSQMGSDDGEERYEEWIVADEDALDERPGYCEFVSRSGSLKILAG